MQQESKSDKYILQVQGVKKHFPIRKGTLKRAIGWIKAVDNVDLVLAQGETLGLVGESGCGKSTLARVILRLLELDTGKIFYKGEDIASYSEKEMKKLRGEMQIVFQDPYGSLNPKLTVESILVDGLKVINFPKIKRKSKVQELLEMVGLSGGCSKRYPHEFSGGQRQRIGLARALSVNPSLIICDEPVSALDVSIQSQMINLLTDLQDKLRLSYLFISHDLNVVGYISDWVAVMYLGEIVEYASTEEIFNNPLHPYTRALLAAAPKPEFSEKSKINILPGEVPNFLTPLEGCKFRARCPEAKSACQKQDILLKSYHREHFVRCLKYVN